MGKSVIALLGMMAVFLAQAQAEWYESGVLTGEIGGESVEMRSYYAKVPDDLGEDIVDELIREFVESFVNGVQHGARYQLVPEVSLGKVVLAQPQIWVSIDLRLDPDPESDGQLAIELSLDPETLELQSDTTVVRYFPRGRDLHDHYGLSEGELLIDEVAHDTDDGSLMIRGRITGQLTYQTSAALVHNPNDALGIDVEFQIDTVATLD